MSSLHVFDVTNLVPYVEPLGTADLERFKNFVDTGSAKCHVPVLKTDTRLQPLSFAKVPNDPWQNVYAEVGLVEVGFEPVTGEDGAFGLLFADLKCHDMGEAQDSGGRVHAVIEGCAITVNRVPGSIAHTQQLERGSDRRFL